MRQKYKYQFRKGSKKEICPNCKKKTFTPYVYSSDIKTAVDVMKYGICDRINSCQYILYPKSADSDSEWKQPIETYQPPQPDFIPYEIVEATFGRFETNTFFIWLVKLFGENRANELQKTYSIGTAKDNGTIFWQKDLEGNFRTGKVMYYQSNGKRNKKRNSWYVHNEIKKDYELHQVLYGENLIKENPVKKVALCESEKTAILMSVFEPQYTWIASGGANMLNEYRLLRLPKLDFVSADEGEFEKWRQQTNIFNNRKMDIRVEQAVQIGMLENGADILDLILLEKINNN